MQSLNETIRVEGVWKTYHTSKTPALQGISFTLTEGTHVALVGPDGAGKTSLLKILAGILKPDKGHVELFGSRWENSTLFLKQQIGYLSQQPGIYGELTVQENLEFFADLQGVKNSKDRIEELLTMTQLSPFRTRLASRLSGGMFQKLALACAILHRPRLLLLDEPTTGVDPVARREFHSLLHQLRREGVTLCMATPAMDEASRCTPVILLYGGRLIAQGDPIALSKQLRGTLYEVRSRTPLKTAKKLKARYPWWSIQVFGDRLHVTVPEEGSSIPESGRESQGDELVDFLSIEGPVQVRIVSPGLEDVFLALTSRFETMETSTGVKVNGHEQ
ncbi:MAG: ABC transporter ATP-binding protein [Spirochaetes bacterium]|nr:ABC transporter ATP-binding protein [Spirochaetota bacterium]